MTPWWAYVTRIAGTAEQKTIADITGIGTSVLSRWSQGSHEPSIKYVTQFARAYGRSPIEALIEAGYIGANEADGVIELNPLPLVDLDDAEIVNEVSRRLDVRRTEYERLLTQIFVAVGQLQSFANAMRDGDETDQTEAIDEICEHLAVLMYSLKQVNEQFTPDRSRRAKLTADTTLKLRARQTGHAVGDAANDLVSQISAWTFTPGYSRGLDADIGYVRDDELNYSLQPPEWARRAKADRVARKNATASPASALDIEHIAVDSVVDASLVRNFATMFGRARAQSGRKNLADHQRRWLQLNGYSPADPDVVYDAEIGDSAYVQYQAVRLAVPKGSDDPNLHELLTLTDDEYRAAETRYNREFAEMVLFGGRTRTATAPALDEYDSEPEPAAARTAPPGYRPGQSGQGDAGGEESQDDPREQS